MGGFAQTRPSHLAPTQAFVQPASITPRPTYPPTHPISSPHLSSSAPSRQSGGEYPDAFCNVTALADELLALTGLTRGAPSLAPAPAPAPTPAPATASTPVAEATTDVSSAAGNPPDPAPAPAPTSAPGVAAAATAMDFSPLPLAPPPSALYPDMVALFALQVRPSYTLSRPLSSPYLVPI